MKVLFDHQTFTLQDYGGISRYFYELIKRFKNVDGSNLSCLVSNNSYLSESNYEGVLPFFHNYKFKGKVRIMKQINEYYSKRNIKRGDFQIFHPTYYSTYFLSEIKSKPFVLTIYDLIHEKFSDQYPELRMDKQISINKRILLDKAARVIAISECTKRDIIDIYNIPEDKIDVIYLGNSLESSGIGAKRLIEQEYILFVGNRSNYKNFNTLLSSIRDLLIKYNLSLVCAGGGDFLIHEIALIKSLDLENHVLSKRILKDEDLANFYANALFFTFPSLYEGFGIPVLEAFACKSPVLMSSGGSLPEVGGHAADYFDATNPVSIFDATEKLINNNARRLELIAAGSDRLNLFSWDQTFKETYHLYNKILLG